MRNKWVDRLIAADMEEVGDGSHPTVKVTVPSKGNCGTNLLRKGYLSFACACIVFFSKVLVQVRRWWMTENNLACLIDDFTHLLFNCV